MKKYKIIENAQKLLCHEASKTYPDISTANWYMRINDELQMVLNLWTLQEYADNSKSKTLNKTKIINKEKRKQTKPTT